MFIYFIFRLSSKRETFDFCSGAWLRKAKPPRLLCQLKELHCDFWPGG